MKLFISRCPQRQKLSNPSKTYRHALVDWKASYPFHHIGIDLMGPLTESNGHKVTLLIGDHLTKWYEAASQPDQRASTTATALIEHWISRLGCPHRIHTDQARNVESLLFKNLLSLLEIDKSRTTVFHPQSNIGHLAYEPHPPKHASEVHKRRAKQLVATTPLRDDSISILCA